MSDYLNLLEKVKNKQNIYKSEQIENDENIFVIADGFLESCVGYLHVCQIVNWFQAQISWNVKDLGLLLEEVIKKTYNYHQR
jgi:hypothetical protein